jgi:hypothetical protein
VAQKEAGMMRRICFGAYAVALAVAAAGPVWASEQEAITEAAQRQALAAQVVQSWEAVQSRAVDVA